MIDVLHLVGSEVSDFYADLSRLYARDCLSATADLDRYRFHIAYVGPDGSWCFPDSLADASLAAAARMDVAEAIGVIRSRGIDLMVPQMFCIPGMTTYRALFDLIGIPYLGNAPAVMALGANKAHARACVASAGVGVPIGEVLSAGDRSTLSPPVVVKPVDADNSLGVSLVLGPDDYAPALEKAFAHASQALVETFVPLGREVRCGVIETADGLVCLPLEEYAMDAETKPIRGLDDKIAKGADDQPYLVAKAAERAWIVPTSDPITDAVWQASLTCHVALGCRDYSLFDFRIDPDGRPWFLEASLYCSFAHQSVLVVMAEAAGLSVKAFFDQTVERRLASATQPSRPREPRDADSTAPSDLPPPPKVSLEHSGLPK